MKPKRRLSYPALILILASLLGVTAFISPFLSAPAQQTSSAAMAHNGDAMLMLTLLGLLALAAVAAGFQSKEMNAKTLAVMGALAAVGAVLRFIPGPGGFSGMFFLPILAGYAFGVQFGFLTGLVTLLASALLAGGIGPWLPYQMFASGWIGALSGLLPRFRPGTRRELVLLTVAGFLLGIFYGLVMNLWFWPFLFRPEQASLYWRPGQGPLSIFKTYLTFYFLTSFFWDFWRGLGNALLILFFGAPVLRLLRRYQQRFHFAVL